MQVRIKPLKKPAKRKGWESTLNIQPQVHLTKLVHCAQVCYPIQLGLCHAQWWQVYHLPMKRSLGRSCNTATLLKNNLITPNRTPSPFQQFFGKGKKSVLTSIQKFGEMCIITYKDITHQAKLDNCGTRGIWVGYAENHPTGTF